MRKRWGIWVLFLLGFLCCCLPLLAHLYSQKEQEQVIATYQKTIQDQKLDVKELRKQAEHYNSILYQTNGATLSGRMHFFWGMRLTHPCWIPPDGGHGKYGHSKDRSGAADLIMEPVKRSYRKGSGICREAASR